jgi:hypothetical protein
MAVSYYNILRAFFGFLVADGVIEASPLKGPRPPLVRQDQVSPFTPAQVEALLAQSHRPTHPKKNEAILLLVDSGLRARGFATDWRRFSGQRARSGVI